MSVKQAANDTEIDENSSATVMGMQLAATASLVLDPNLAPLKYDGNYTLSNPSPSRERDAHERVGAVLSVMATEPQQFALVAPTRHFIVVEQGLLAGLFVLPAQLAAWKETAVTWISPATAQSQLLTVAPAARNRAPAQRRTGE